MSALDWLILLAYVIGYVKTVPRAVRAMLDEMAPASVETIDYAFAGFVGLFVSLFWPVLAIGMAIGKRVVRSTDVKRKS